MTRVKPLLIIVPTRRRRANVERFLDAWIWTAQIADCLLVTDDDDDSYDGLRLPEDVRIAQGPRAWLTQKLNRHAMPAARTYATVGFLGDDCVPQNSGWDRMLYEALETPGIAYPDDQRRRDLGEHEVISSCIIRALGWYFEPTLNHYWTDNVWADIGRAAGCYRRVESAKIRHLHHDAGGRLDATYSESADANGARDSAAYQAWKAERMGHDVAVVRSVIDASAGTQ